MTRGVEARAARRVTERRKEVRVGAIVAVAAGEETVVEVEAEGVVVEVEEEATATGGPAGQLLHPCGCRSQAEDSNYGAAPTGTPTSSVTRSSTRYTVLLYRYIHTATETLITVQRVQAVTNSSLGFITMLQILAALQYTVHPNELFCM